MKNTHRFLFVLLFAVATRSVAGDWPMWKYDSGRTAASPDALPKTLHLQWVRKLPTARQAWRDKSNAKLFFDVSYEPIVAGKLMFVGSMNSDSVTAYSTETGAEKWRFYTAGPVRFAPVAYKGKLFVGSDDGYLYCLKASTGTLVWKKRGGPSDHKVLGNSRLIGMWPFRGAPVIHNDVLYCAAGIWPFMGTFIYALDPATGREIWANSGNGSRWIIQQHRAPSFAGIAPQGYLATTGDKLLIPSGRSVPGAFSTKDGSFLYNHASSRKYGKGVGGYSVSVAGKTFFVQCALYSLDKGGALGLIGQGVLTASAHYLVEDDNLMITPLDGKPIPSTKKKKKSANGVKIPKKVGRAYIKAGSLLYCARKGGIVSAVSIANVKAPSVPWQGKIDGEVWTMLAADDRLFVVNTAGSIFCFGAKKDRVVNHATKKQAPPAGKTSPLVDAALKNCGDPSGYAVVIGADKDVITALLSRSKFHVIVVDPRPQTVAYLRRRMDDSGLYGDRVAAIVADPFKAELPPYLANALILTSQQKLDAGKLSSLFKVLRPYGGVAVLPEKTRAVDTLAKSAGLQKAKATQVGNVCVLKREGSLPGSAPWSHQYADAGNSVISKDKLIKPPFGLLWFGGPTNDAVLPRHGHGPNPEVAGGRIFIEGPNMLRSLDAYTGRLLWERQLKGIGHYYNNTDHHPGANEIGSNYVSLEDAVYLLYKEKCLKLDPATGKTTKEFTLPAGKDGKLPTLGSLRVEGDYLVLTSGTLGISITPEVFPVKDGKNITLQNAKAVTIKSGVGATITGASKSGKYSVAYYEAKLVKKGGKVTLVRDGKHIKTREPKKLLKIERFMDLQIGFCKSVTLAEGNGITVSDAKGIKAKGGIDTNVPYASASRTLAVLDRHSGKLLWSRQAVYGFRHNAVIAAGDRVYCLDKLTSVKEGFLMRRGLFPMIRTAGRPASKTPSLLALDIRTGKVVWQSKKDIFGTWLGYSREHDVLVQGGSASGDRARDEVGTGISSYRGKDGKVLWKNLEIKYTGPLMLRHHEMITNGKEGVAMDLLTGKSSSWRWVRYHGCNTAIGGEHVLTFRSGAAGYYDITRKGGTGNLGGFKSGCSSNLILGDGLLAAPDYTRTCKCSYQNQTSLALRYMPEAEIWTFQAMETPGKLGVNFGAPGDRVSQTGTLWSEFPHAGSPPMKREVKADGKPFRYHSMLFTGNAERWVGASGLEDVKRITVKVPTKGAHTVRLYFAEPNLKAKPGSRVFSVSLGGKKVLTGLDIVRVAGVPRKVIVKELKGVQIGTSLELSFAAEKGKPLICGVEIVSKQETASAKR